ncbi:MAG: transcriptional regulator [Pseudonocardiaceae bacterium]
MQAKQAHAAKQQAQRRARAEATARQLQMTPHPESSDALTAPAGTSANASLSEQEILRRGLNESVTNNTIKATGGEFRNYRELAWIVDHSSLSFDEVHQALKTRMAKLQQSDPPLKRYERVYRRSKVTRRQIADFLWHYYEHSMPSKMGYCTVRSGGDTLKLSVLTKPEWLDLNVHLGGDNERFLLSSGDSPGATPKLVDGPLDAAIQRLAEAELDGTRFFGTPSYRLLDFLLSDGGLQAEFAVTDSANYIFTLDLLEAELLETLASGEPAIGKGGPLFPLRDHYLPNIDTILDFDNRTCLGGPLALFAAARPGTRRAPNTPDFTLLVQERSAQVMNMTGRLAVIPKCFHEPLASRTEDVPLSASLERELEEELLGRPELENSPTHPVRKVDPMHLNEISAPMRWLEEHRGTDSYRVECVGFGINAVSGNYEFPCIIVIDDDEWWGKFGGHVEGNWEVNRIRQYSSRDREGISALLKDSAWSNEGLFAFSAGLRRLAAVGGSRVDVPDVELEA